MVVRPSTALLLILVSAAALLGGCASTSHPKPSPSGSAAPSNAPARSGGYYEDDGPGANPPDHLDQVPDALPRLEPYASGANRPYSVFGKDYQPDTSDRPYVQRGVASWYGRKFHGQRTSSGEIYDMYAMTAAHPTLPIPSYAWVRNPANGRAVIVRINDRGPFHSGRIIDLSYAAALRLGILQQGSGLVEVERILPSDISTGRYALAKPPPPSASDKALVSASANGPSASPPPAVRLADASLPSAPAVTAASAAGTGAAAPMPAELPADLVGADLRDAALAASSSDTVPPQAAGADADAAGGEYVQLGAFRQRSGAEDFAKRTRSQLDPDLAVRLRIVELGEFFRVQLGPYEASTAESVADRILRSLGLTSVLVKP